MNIGEFIFSRITIVLGIIMVLSIPALLTWPLFHVKSGEVSLIVEDSIIKKEDGKKLHNVWFNCGSRLEHERYDISSKREMSLYNKLCNDRVYMKESVVLEITYVVLWFFTLMSFLYCWFESLFGNDLYDSEKEKLAKFYVKIIKKILKFLGHDPEKVENLVLTIQYDKRLSFIGCFIKLAHSLQECT